MVDVNYAKSIPLRLPYIDCTALRSIEPIELRYLTATSWPKPIVAAQHDVSHVPDLVLAQWQAAQYVSKQLQDKGILAIDASAKSGLDATLFAKYRSGSRPFSPLPSTLVPLCYTVLHQSCHRVMFGDEGAIRLPRLYSVVARRMLLMSADAINDLLAAAKAQQKVYEAQTPVLYPNTPRRSINTIVRERMTDILCDSGHQTLSFFGRDTPEGVKNNIRTYFDDSYKRTKPHLLFLMYMAFETGMALDFFIAENFCQYVPCYYHDNGHDVLVDDQRVLDYIGICASLPPENRITLFADALSRSF